MITSINNNLPVIEGKIPLRVTTRDGFIDVVFGLHSDQTELIHVLLNNEGREVLRFSEFCAPAKRSLWERLQDWMDRHFPRTTPAQREQLDA